jgi:hypothetical protein
VKKLLAVFLLFATPAHAAFTDGWRFNDLLSKTNPFFSEFKYFNFHNEKGPELSGAITYAVIAPGYVRKLRVSAYFYESGRFHTIQREYPLKCVTASASSLDARICGEGAIQVLAWGPSEVRLRISQLTGDIRWELDIAAPMAQFTDRESVFEIGKDVVD